MNKKTIKTIIIILLMYPSYFFMKGVYDANFNDNANIITSSIKANDMNSVAKYFYKLGLKTK